MKIGDGSNTRIVSFSLILSFFDLWIIAHLDIVEVVISFCAWDILTQSCLFVWFRLCEIVFWREAYFAHLLWQVNPAVFLHRFLLTRLKLTFFLFTFPLAEPVKLHLRNTYLLKLVNTQRWSEHRYNHCIILDISYFQVCTHNVVPHWVLVLGVALRTCCFEELAVVDERNITLEGVFECALR